jgi:hypothetical protein
VLTGRKEFGRGRALSELSAKRIAQKSSCPQCKIKLA